MNGWKNLCAIRSRCCAKMEIFKVVCTLCATPKFHWRKKKERKKKLWNEHTNILLVIFSIVFRRFSRLERLWTFEANQIDVVCIAHSHLMLKTSRLAQKSFSLLDMYNVPGSVFFPPHFNFVLRFSISTRTGEKKTAFVRYRIMEKRKIVAYNVQVGGSWEFNVFFCF